MNERRWAENEFALAQDLAESINWEATRGEERVALLLLAELSALFDPERGKYYISRYDHLDRMRSNLVQTAFDDRLPAMRDFANGVVMAATGRRSDAEQSLRKAWRIFDDIGYDMRAGRVAAALYRVTEKNRWRHLAEDKFEAYPHSWLYHELAVGQRSDRAAPDLTPMQDRIMRLVRQGLSTDEIASHLGRSRNTVLNHLKIVYKKLGVNSREGLVAEALRRGLVS
jgi:DNA-binding CsgD family transcriptional regulator